MYSGNKAAIEYFTRVISLENPQHIFLDLAPGSVSTKGTGRPPRGDCITATDCVKGALKFIGRTPVTYGHWKHRVMGAFMKIAPARIINGAMLKLSLKIADSRKKTETLR